MSHTENSTRILNSTLWEFYEYRTCPKCGFDNPSVRYCPDAPAWGEECRSLDEPTPKDIAAYEHLHRECKRCNYTWLERPLS